MPVRDLAQGMSGEDVKAIQNALNTWGADPPLPTSVKDGYGKFGPKTDTAVRAFQRKNRLNVDGVVGRDTRKALFPVGVATVTVFGMRLRETGSQRRSPLWPGPLTLDPKLTGEILGYLKRPDYDLLRLPALDTSLHAPDVPDWNLKIPALSNKRPAQLLGFEYDHLELQPAAQSTFPLGGVRQDAFILTMQTIYRCGPDDGPHQEGVLGVQVGAPFSSPGGPWTVNPFVQLTDVDRFGALGGGNFHWWQPYAQAGFQFSGPGSPQPALTGGLFPVNLGLDVGDILTVNLAGGLALTMDLNSGRVQAGPQVSAGLTLKFGRATE